MRVPAISNMIPKEQVYNKYIKPFELYNSVLFGYFTKKKKKKM